MIIEIVRTQERDGWRVDLARPNYRLGRHIVEITKLEGADKGGSWCVGFADEPAEGDRLYELAVRTVQLVSTGEGESVDWMERGPGDPVI